MSGSDFYFKVHQKSSMYNWLILSVVSVAAFGYLWYFYLKASEDIANSALIATVNFSRHDIILEEDN